MARPAFQITRKVEPVQLLDTLIVLLRRYLPLELQKTRITPEDVWQVLGYAALRQQTIETACSELAQAPSGNRLREVLLAALPPLPQLQGQLNRALRAQLPRARFKRRRPFRTAFDLVLIPYHGQPQAEATELLRADARSGTTHFHGYATVAIVHDKRRYTLGVYFVAAGQTMAAIARRLLDRLKRLQIAIKRIYAEAGFCSIGVLRLLDRRGLPYILPLPVRGRSGGVRKLFAAKKSYFGTYTLSSSEQGRYTVPVAVAQRYLNGRYGKHGCAWFAFVVAGLPASATPAQVFEWYRQRFGIESGYRQMHAVRARTASRSPVLRRLLVGLALLLFNLYIAVRRTLTAHPSPQEHPDWLPFDQLMSALQRAIEDRFGCCSEFHLRAAALFS